MILKKLNSVTDSIVRRMKLLHKKTAHIKPITYVLFTLASRSFSLAECDAQDLGQGTRCIIQVEVGKWWVVGGYIPCKMEGNQLRSW